MSAATQKRMLTAPKSKLGKVDIVSALRKDEAWAILPEEERQRLYSLLPPPQAGEPEHDIDIHPLNTQYRVFIEAELHHWQNDLVDGREVKKWREEAIQAGNDRLEGKFDDLKGHQREERMKRENGTGTGKLPNGDVVNGSLSSQSEVKAASPEL